MLPVEQPFKIYTGLDGKPLDSGFIWFGQENLNPITSPAPVYWDAAGTIPAAQPLRTVNGYIVRGGTPANVFTDSVYSELVRDSKGRQVFYARTSTEFSIASAIKSFIASLAASAGSSLIGFIQAGTGAVLRTVQDRLRDTFSVKDFGAKGDGVADDTQAIQRAINLVNTKGGGALDFPAGTYLLSATLTLYTNVRLRGQGGTSTILKRTGSYGDTIQQTNGFCKIDGFFFQHGTNCKAGDVKLDVPLSDGSAHIRLVNTQNAEIRSNIIWRMPYGIVCDGAINTEIQDNWIQGVWDPMYAAMQEGIADIFFTATSQHGQLAKVFKNYFSGAVNSTRPVTYSDGTNSVTKSFPSNVGSKNNILATSIEGLHAHGNYFGRAAFQLLRLAPMAGANGIVSDIRITGNFFDDTGAPGATRTCSQITAESGSAGAFVLGLAVSGNTFNGEYDTLHALEATPNAADNSASVLNLEWGNNSHFAHVATPLVLTGVCDGAVNGNVFQNYNSLNVSTSAAGSLTFTTAVYVGPYSSNISVTSNTIGSGGNDGSDGANYCYRGVEIDAAASDCIAYDNLYAGLKNGSNVMRGLARDEGQYVHSAAGNYQMTPKQQVYIRAKPTSEASVVGLPMYPVMGMEVVVKDGKGDASSSSLIVSVTDSTTIDGSSSINITTNYGFRRVRFNGTQWNVIG